MAHLPNTRLPLVRPTDDGKWLRCPQCSKAYWGAFRPTDFVLDKLNAHLDKAHKAQGPEAGADAPADIPVAKPVAKRPAPRARNARKIAKIAEVAQKKGDGPVQIVRTAGPRTPDLELLADDIVVDIAQAMALHPRLQGGQGPRDFPEDGDARHVKDAGKGQDVVARVMATLSPVRWPDGRLAV
jgi:hypothetical protein